MKKNLRHVVIAGSMVLLASCAGNVKENLGLKGNAPDEFRVISKPPLSIPPNFNLRPPREGGAVESTSTVREEAKDILFSTDKDNVRSHSEDSGENVLLNKVGEGDSNIRSVLHEEQGSVQAAKKKPGFFGKLFGKKEKEVPDTLVNAPEESKRIRENIKHNKPVTKGETPTIDPGKQGILQKIFSRSSDE